MAPYYTYLNEQTGETKDVFQGMNDEHSFSEDGVAWKRIFYAPNASIDTKIDPHSQKQFVEKTGTKKGTVGDILDLSAELSSKRAERAGGEDPVKRKFFDDYKKKNKGAKHMSDTPKKIDTKVATIEF